jgi:hypothetical protein
VIEIETGIETGSEIETGQVALHWLDQMIG